MNARVLPLLPLALLAVAASAPARRAHAEEATTPPEYKQSVEVTATRIPVEVDRVPQSITVVSGDELRAWGATDLTSALAFIEGVEVSPGGDNGPRSSVPAFWGLREFDAFLLVVDGVPWGGAFNPALASVDLNDVERIEVLRGPAPVTYGATSFVGVIQVIHRGAEEGREGGTATGRFGSYESGGGSVVTALPQWAGFHSTLTADASRQGYRDDRTSYRLGHARLSNLRGAFNFDVDALFLGQEPASPHPRQGPALSDAVPLDANHNPEDAELNQNRVQLGAGWTRPGFKSSDFALKGSFTHESGEAFRGFLLGVSGDDPNAHGFDSESDVNDLYLDAHLAWTRSERWKGLAGIDHLHGKGEVEGGDFDYLVSLDGSGAPGEDDVEPEGDLFVEDRREFTGFYGLAEWIPSSRVQVELGLRLNHTWEEREAGAGGEEDRGEEDKPSRSDTRLSGSAGVTVTAWEDEHDNLRFYGNVKNTYKPAAVDLNLGEGEEAGGEEEGILKPETAWSGELGLKTTLMDGRISGEANYFRQDLENLVLSQVVDGLPSLINGGKTRFEGFETAMRTRLPHDLSLRMTYAFHNARFRDFLTEFDGVPTQLAGKRFEMSPRHLASWGLGYFPARGILGLARVNYVGDRYLNKRNTALAADYATLALGVGWRAERWDVRLDGSNLTDKRPAISESEVGDAQYYRLPARRVDVTTSFHF